MPKNTRNPFGRRGGGTVTVIEDRVQRSAIRRAKIAFWVTAVIVTVLAAIIAASYINPMLAVIIGVLAGGLIGGIVFIAVVIWPIVRALWWWLPEISATGALGYGWTQLAEHTTLIPRLLIVAVVIGVPAGVPAIRRRVLAIIWCLISRHRIRVCFAQFIITNRYDSHPFILWARPTPVGERVWMWLRPGLAIDDIESRLDKIAAACWASNVTVERASKTNAAYLRLDIKRGDALTRVIPSPLAGLIGPNTPVPATERAPVVAPTALDLPDVAAETVRELDTKNAGRTDTKPDKKPASTPAADRDELDDWI